ncbi:MAG: serine hydrolase [Myxococcales bacterium]
MKRSQDDSFALLALTVAVAWFGAVACSSEAEKGTRDSGVTADAGAEGRGGDGGGEGAGQLPDSAEGRALGWVMAALNGAPPTEEDVAARFSAAFLSQVPPAQVIDVLAQLSASGPWTVIGFEGPSGPSGQPGQPDLASLTAVVTRGDGRYWRILVALDGLGKIGGLLLVSAGDLDPALQSWDAIEQALTALPGKVNLLAAELGDDASSTACTPLHTVAADSSLTVGSTFKLWVLAALAEDIRVGKHTWTDTLAIQDQHKSLPSGMLQDQPVGTLLPLRTYANQMIAISDNTAADHLLFFVGRDVVEAMVSRTGHHDPMQNQPFLATRELFNLKLMATAAEQQSYVGASVTERRALLETYNAAYDPRLYTGLLWTQPRAIDKLEWFATPGDLCGVVRALRDYGDQAATQPVRDILAANPGIGDASGAFSYIGFKGGSEPGVLNLTWLLRRRVDQKWLFLTMGFNDPTREVDEDTAVYLAAAARGLLGAPPATN